MASIKNYLVERIKSYVYHNYGNKFIRKFNILNKIYLKYPLKIGFLSNSNCYYANDNKGYKIFYSVPQRTERFKNGILNRLEYLYNEYIMDGCKINDGDIIIDVGANIGEFSMALNNKFKVQILAIEPEEKEYKCLKLNTENTNTISKQVALW